MSKERPILFNGDMVRAILEGRKTQTRRPIEPQLDYHVAITPCRSKWSWRNSNKYGLSELLNLLLESKSPAGKVGDTLWVRETFAVDPTCHPAEAGYLYRATQPEWDEEETDLKWTPSIHMPRDASRISLMVKDVRLERLHEMSDDDVTSEGFVDGGEWGSHFFEQTWDSIYSSAGYSWESNPWVWVVEFEVAEVKGGGHV